MKYDHNVFLENKQFFVHNETIYETRILKLNDIQNTHPLMTANVDNIMTWTYSWFANHLVTLPLSHDYIY